MLAPVRVRGLASARGAGLLIAGMVIATPRAVPAKAAKAVVPGERHGLLVPVAATAVRIDRASVSFALTRELHEAAVTAVYWLTNTTGVSEPIDVALVFARGDASEADPRPAIEADGAPVSFHAATSGAVLAPRLGAWLEGHPEVARELRAPGGCTDPDQLRTLVAAAGGRCDGPCSRLVSWQASLNAVGIDRTGAREDERVFEAACEAIPGEVAELVERWAALADQGHLTFVLFHLDFEPHQTRRVAVHYEHRAAIDRDAHANPTFGFDYLLPPARRWEGMGPLDVTVRVPGHARFTPSIPFLGDGDTYHTELTVAAGGDVRFEVMSLDGLWLGMTERRGYWAIAIAASAIVTACFGVAAGRRWAGGSGWRRVVIPLLTAGPLAAVGTLAVLVVLLSAFPPHALGFGYAPLLRAALLIVVAVPLGAAAAAARSSA
jgi:hypothetical protein